jgi:hypothetical protein
MTSSRFIFEEPLWNSGNDDTRKESVVRFWLPSDLVTLMGNVRLGSQERKDASHRV